MTASSPKPQRVSNMNIPVAKMIRAVDPDFERAKKREIEYDFGPKGRIFTADPSKRGAYSAN